MSDNQREAQPSTGAVPEVDRIRDIIFGTQMRDYDQQFQVLQRDLERLQTELDRLNEELNARDSEQGKKLQGLRQELHQADNDLRDEVRDTAQRMTNEKVDRVSLAELFIELGSQLRNGGTFADVLANLNKSE